MAPLAIVQATLVTLVLAWIWRLMGPEPRTTKIPARVTILLILGAWVLYLRGM